MKPDAIITRASRLGLAPRAALLWTVSNDAYGDGRVSMEGVRAARLARALLRRGVVLDPWEAIDYSLAMATPLVGRWYRIDGVVNANARTVERRERDAQEYARAVADAEYRAACRSLDNDIPF